MCSNDIQEFDYDPSDPFQGIPYEVVDSIVNEVVKMKLQDVISGSYFTLTKNKNARIYFKSSKDFMVNGKCLCYYEYSDGHHTDILLDPDREVFLCFY